MTTVRNNQSQIDALRRPRGQKRADTRRLKPTGHCRAVAPTVTGSPAAPFQLPPLSAAQMENHAYMNSARARAMSSFSLVSQVYIPCAAESVPERNDARGIDIYGKLSIPKILFED